MEVASASSSTKPQLPAWIFLSHSGQQKGSFVTHLYHALCHAKHQPFFDIDYADSLPVGVDYPPRIFQACLDCKIAVVVLSEDYVTSLWPMLELQHLLLPSRPDRLVYPLFYLLKPADLSNPAKLESWQACWAHQAQDWHIKMQKLQEYMSSTGSELQINLDIESWSDNLSKLKWRSGSVRHVFQADHKRSFYASDHEYIQAIVSNICVQFPPPTEYALEAGIIGQARMQQEIGKVFQEEGSIGGDEVGSIGVYGIGGIGKSTLCKMMVNFYGSEFPGRCFYLELPSNGDDVMKILVGIKAIIHTAKDVTSIDQAMGALEEELRRKKFFLAIDNIWGNTMKSDINCFEYAKRIMLMEFALGSKIMLTSRSKELLGLLLESRPAMTNKMMGKAQFRPSVVHIPSLTHAEAVDALRSRYGYRSSFIPEDCLQRLARSCFFEGQCHPLYLKLKGVELEQKGRTSFTDQQWKDLISSLEVRRGGGSAQDSNMSATNTNYSEQVVLRTVEKSLDALPADLQDIFIDLATWPAVKYDLYSYMQVIDIPTFVRYDYDDCTEEAMFYKVLELQHHGLLEIEFDSDYCEGDRFRRDKIIVIHDLLKLVAKSRVSLPNVHSVAKDAMFDAVVTSTDDQLLQKKHVSTGENLKASTWRALFGSSTTSISRILLRKRINPVKVQIRSLLIDGAVLLGRRYSSSVVRQYICPSAAVPWRRLCLKNNGRDMKALRVLHLQGIKELREIQGWEGVPNLMVLSLSELYGLERIGSIGCLTRLERLALVRCKDLEVQALVGAGAGMSLVKPGDKLPMLQHLIVEFNLHLTEVGPHLFDAFPALKLLRLWSCPKLESFPDLNSGKLRALEIHNCQKLKSIEGITDSSLTALQRLVLEGCRSLERMSDISKVKSTDLRVLDAYSSCPSEVGNQLRFMMVNSCCGHDDNRLRELGLSISIPSEKYTMSGTDDEVGLNHIESASCGSSTAYESAAASSSIPALRLGDALLSCDPGSSQYNCRKQLIVNEGMAQFVHLKRLKISAELEAEYPCWQLDTSGLPCNLEELTLEGFESVQKLVMSSSLVNLRVVELTELRALERLFDAATSGQLPSLEYLSVVFCGKVAELPNLATISPSLKTLHLYGCTSLTDVSGVADLPNLCNLWMYDCTSLTDVSGVAGLTSLKWLQLTRCTSLRRIPNLRHLGALGRLKISRPGSCWELRKEEDLRELLNDGVEVKLKLE